MGALVSVVTPTCHRHESLVNLCIPSVKRQTYPNIEHIVISDGPDPELKELLKDKGVTYLELPRNWKQFTNGESFGAVPRNTALAFAQGEYVAYLDDDDEFTPDHIESMVNLMESQGTDIAYGQMQRDLDGVNDLLIGDGTIQYGHIGMAIVHKTVCLRAGFIPLHGYSEDFDFVKHMVDCGFKVSFLPKVTYLYHKKK